MRLDPELLARGTEEEVVAACAAIARAPAIRVVPSGDPAAVRTAVRAVAGRGLRCVLVVWGGVDEELLAAALAEGLGAVSVRAASGGGSGLQTEARGDAAAGPGPTDVQPLADEVRDRVRGWLDAARRLGVRAVVEIVLGVDPPAGMVEAAQVGRASLLVRGERPPGSLAERRAWLVELQGLIAAADAARVPVQIRDLPLAPGDPAVGWDEAARHGRAAAGGVGRDSATARSGGGGAAASGDEPSAGVGAGARADGAETPGAGLVVAARAANVGDPCGAAPVGLRGQEVLRLRMSDGVLEALRVGACLPAAERGLVMCASDGPAPEQAIRRVVPRLEDLAGLMHAVGWPLVDLPRGLPGGQAESLDARVAAVWGELAAPPSPPPRPRSAVVVHPWGADRVLRWHTLPALVRALSAIGVDARLHSAWGGLTEEVANSVLAEGRAGKAMEDAARQATPALLASVPTDVDLVVVAGWETATEVAPAVLAGGRARLVVLDLHMLDGFELWKARFMPKGTRSMEGGWWPSERVSVINCFPGYAMLYAFSGVPFRQIGWSPYPVPRAFVADADPLAGRHIFFGGAHLREIGLLSDAIRAAGPLRHPVELFAPGRHEGLPDGVVVRGVRPVREFAAGIAKARFVINLVRYVHDRAAGISVAALALGAGVPIVASATPAMRDHVRHGVDGLLIAEDDPQGLADAIRRLDQDDELLARLTEGAREASERIEVGALARMLVGDEVGGWPVR